MKKEIGVLAIAGATLFVGGCTNAEPTAKSEGFPQVTPNFTIIDMGNMNGTHELYKSIDRTNGQVCYVAIETFSQPGPVSIFCPVSPTSSPK